jgi:hypothetical protein
MAADDFNRQDLRLCKKERPLNVHLSDLKCISFYRNRSAGHFRTAFPGPFCSRSGAFAWALSFLSFWH